MTINVLVTGGAGYIGSHTAKLLGSKGIVPVVYDNLATGHESSARWGPLVRGDILDTDHLTLYADPTIARRILGFSADHSDLDTIVRTAAPFFGLEARP
jgi:UDP-arabinose 4-epimerase